ncbi:short-chain dehydrogenase/reductase SDR [Geobacter metallireducens RCH3]|uniref:2-[hydroxy(Phenyl)methyl]-succinyl-CoA dehydrogenase subunit n=1 Tax=Geobacter metallireducens (strain ATCC 53774 / DSM 7210 / GS-15) TaxID=269799 RepID=Q39VF9_GEOMG|nr:SDR family NAD(P)-dependent oxidoreductase [Geobacter metallireducens]ABB31765.1 2-[hydroxy(phenyl)methyl]-succinyl-CoA dehydrogenase subunit [Geobacter metallireducens GS-15]EHP89357.1 short-chain dehydrogenase/reductase SDR [Geobacter metallireducens RCH3]
MAGLQGKVALITGSASGMGKKTAQRLAEKGVKIVINDIVSEKVDQTVKEFSAQGFEVMGVVADICKTSAVQEMVKSAVERFGSLDILVNNAGMERAGALRNLSETDWDLTVDVNLKGAFLCSQAAHGHMIEQGGGRIVNIASRAWLGGAGQAPYSSAKAGLVGLTRTLALELGRKGVTVNCIAPGLIHTPMWDELPEKNRLGFLAKQPMGKIGEDEDIANAVLFFLDDEASFITGQVFYVCGGRSLFAG